MTRTPTKTLAALLVLLAATSIAISAPDGALAPAPNETWPQWRGPLGTGAAPDADPPTTWSETENVR